MSDANTQIPFRPLGAKLRTLREKHHESVAEVCGAVEIDESLLERIESGHERPSEDILLLLISHFDVHDEHAAELWQLAGYDETRVNDNDNHSSNMGPDRNDSRTQAMMIMIDPRVMYTDNVEITANQQGVVINFGQTGATNSQSLTVSRIGMSYDQAKAIMGMLHQVLYDAENPGNSRRLNDGNGNHRDTDSSSGTKGTSKPTAHS